MNDINIYRQLHTLYSDSQKYREHGNLKAIFRYVAAFPDYAVFNLMLVSIQRPGARYFTTRKLWHDRFKRSVKPEANPMVILRPFGPVEFVYDVSDTYGNSLPPEIESPFEFSGQGVDLPSLEAMRERLSDNLPKVGVAFKRVTYGSQQAGCLRLLPAPQFVQTQKKTYRIDYQMEVGQNLGCIATLATMAHELGHLFCGHLGQFDVTPNRHNLSLNSCEFEAESVCWLFCKRRGFDHTPSVSYLNGYLEGGREIPAIDIGAIMYAVNQLESLLKPSAHFMNSLEVKKTSHQLSLFAEI